MDNYTTEIIRIQDYDLVLDNISHEYDKSNKKIIVLNCSHKINDQIAICPDCGSVSVRVKDYYTRTIKYIEMFGYPSLIRFKQKRVVCNDCKKTFNIGSPIVKKGCSISNPTRLKIIQEAKNKQSFKDIAIRCNISQTSTINTFSNSVSISRNELTEIICIDEFKANTEFGKYAFIMADPLTSKIIDVLPSRTQEYIYHYFNQIEPKERFKVKYLVSDMYESFRTVKRELFTDAIHIADRFHWIRCATEAFNKVRIRIMKNYQKELDITRDIDLKRELRLYINAMKGNYKLLLANKYRKEQTFYSSLGKISGYKEEITKQEIIDLILNSDEELENSYFLLQDLYKLSIFSNYDDVKDILLDWIKKAKESKIKEFYECCNTYTSWLKEIINSFIINDKTKKRLANGFIEGKNNLCKVVKRIGFGYKKFDLLRNRLLYISNNNQRISN